MFKVFRENERQTDNSTFRPNGRKTTIPNGRGYRASRNLRVDLGFGKSRKVNKTVPLSVQSREESPHQVTPLT